MGRITWNSANTTTYSHTPSSPLAQHIGEQLRRQREKLQITIRDVHEKTGLSAAFVCDMENGKQCPGAETLWRLSKALGVPVSYWFKKFEE